MNSLTAPKADALPGCATPRTAISLGNAAVDGNPGDAVRGNTRQDEARTGNGSPGILHNHEPTFTTRAELEAWAVEMAHWANCTPGQTMRARLEALDLIRRVTLAHVHLGEGMTSHPHPKETSGE